MQVCENPPPSHAVSTEANPNLGSVLAGPGKHTLTLSCNYEELMAVVLVSLAARTEAWHAVLQPWRSVSARVHAGVLYGLRAGDTLDGFLRHSLCHEAPTVRAAVH